MIRRLASICLALLLSASVAFAGPNGQGISVNGAIGTGGQLIGTKTNDNACTGCVGEILSAQVTGGAPTAISSNVIFDLATVTLTPGDWDVSGILGFIEASGTVTTSVSGWISTTSLTLPGAPNSGAYLSLPATLAASSVFGASVGTIRVSVAVNTPVYLSGSVLFSVSTNAAFGYLRAVRRR